MDSATRLQLMARITYYIGGVAALCGGLAHFGVAAGLLRSIDLPQRNLFEGSMMFFIISIASAARGLASEKAK